MTDAPWVFCGARRLTVPADRFEPPARLPAPEALGWAIGCALAEPIASPLLAELTDGASRVIVTVPDGTRPCPTAGLLPPLLAELNRGGVPDDHIAIAIGCGLHRTTTAEEKVALVGAEAAGRVRVFDAQGLEQDNLELGCTTQGAPIVLNREVAEARLVVTVGVVEPHQYAGFSGGVKGVAVGCAGAETIAWTHQPAFISEPGVAIARLAGNPFQMALREIAGYCRLRFALNVSVNEDGAAIMVAAGDPVHAHQSLAFALLESWLRPQQERFDVVLAGVHNPKDASLYQASRAATYIGLAARPAVADDALIVLCAGLAQGAGDGPAERNFAALLAAAASWTSLIARGLREPLGPGGQRAFVLARVLERYRVAVVGATEPGFLAPLGLATFDSVEAALADAARHLGRPPRVLAVADAMTTLVSLA
jgi:nickel-dependent lactate racemase